MSDSLEPSNWCLDACPACNGTATAPAEVRMGFYTCPRCGRKLRFARDCADRPSARFFDAGDLPGRVRVKSGTFGGYEGLVLCQAPTANRVVIVAEISGRITPIQIDLNELEEVK